MSSEISLLFCVLCHQTYRIGVTFIDPVHFVDSSIIIAMGLHTVIRIAYIITFSTIHHYLYV